MDSMLTVMYLIFAITTLPLQLFLFLYDFHIIHIYHGIKLTFDVFLIIFYVQILANPSVLLYMGEEYRTEMVNLKKYFCSLSSNKNCRKCEIGEEKTRKLRKHQETLIDEKFVPLMTSDSVPGRNKDKRDTCEIECKCFYFSSGFHEIVQHDNKSNVKSIAILHKYISTSNTECTDVSIEEEHDLLKKTSNTIQNHLNVTKNDCVAIVECEKDWVSDRNDWVSDRKDWVSDRKDWVSDRKDLVSDRKDWASDKEDNKISNSKITEREGKETYNNRKKVFVHSSSPTLIQDNFLEEKSNTIQNEISVDISNHDGYINGKSFDDKQMLLTTSFVVKNNRRISPCVVENIIHCDLVMNYTKPNKDCMGVLGGPNRETTL